MKFAVFATLLTATTTSALKASSPIAQKLMSSSRRLEDDNDAASWIVDYSLQFQSCHVINSFNFGEEQGDNQGNGQQSVVKFKLCPSNKCGSGCSGAEYVAPLDMFVNAYTEWEMNDKEYKCEQVRENCYCDNANDDEACEYQCYVSAGLQDVCVEQEKNDDGYEFDLQDWMECKEIEANDNYQQYYVGPKCSSSGQKINLGVFTDEFCTQEYSDSMFKSAYGISLPYASSNIVAENCISCKVEDANNNGYYQDPEITEICEESYMQAARCESKFSNTVANADETGCSYVNNLELYEVGYTPTTKNTAVGFAVFFALTTAALGAYVAKTHMDGKRTINLNSEPIV